MADDITTKPESADGAARNTAAPPAGGDSPDRTLVMNPMPDKTLVLNSIPDRTVVLDASSGVRKTSSGPHRTRSFSPGDTRSRIRTILRNPTALLSVFSGTGSKRDVGEEIDGMDHRRTRAEIGHTDVEPHFPDIEERYTLERKLVEGRSSVISLGREIGLERQVTIRSLKEEKLLNPEERRVFISEAEISAQLDHPAILPVYSINSDYRGGLHSAVKLTEGTDLRKYLERISSHYRTDGMKIMEEQKSLRHRLDLFLGVCDGLSYAHSRNIMHCNLHPFNILIGEYHEVYIKGWGASRLIRDPEHKQPPPESSPTADPRFIAPEFITGSPSDARADVYSLGMMLFEVVTLHPPFPEAAFAEVLENVNNGEPPEIEHRFGCPIDADLRAVLQKAIAPKMEDRYSTVGELADDLRHFLASEATSLRKISLTKRYARLIREHHRGMFFFFLLILLLGGALLAFDIFSSVMTAQTAYIDEHVLGSAMANCRKTAHHFNLQADKFNRMLESLKFEAETLLASRPVPASNGAQYFASPNDPALAASGVPTEYSPIYGGSISFRRIEAGRIADLKDSSFTKLGLLLPTMFRFTLLAPMNAFISHESEEKQLYNLMRVGSPVFRFQISLPNGASLHYPFTLEPEALPPENAAWYKNTLADETGRPIWGLPFQVAKNAAQNPVYAVPVSIRLGAVESPLGAAAVLVSGKHISSLLNESGSLSHGLAAQYLIAENGDVKLERLNDAAKTMALEKGPYPDPWLVDWLRTADFGAVIHEEDDGEFVYCFAFLSSIRVWYVEKISLTGFLESLDREQQEKGAAE